MRDKIMRFMAGRYGRLDSLGKFTIIAALAAFVLARWADSTILYLLAWASIAYCYYRLFSRNIYKRTAENQAWLNKTVKIRSWFKNQKSSLHTRKDYHIYKCPSCKQKIRIPRGKGRIEISCPKCHASFIKKS